MNWWGKIVGGTLGYVIGGPLGGIFGMAAGHNIDRSLRRNRPLPAAVADAAVPAADTQDEDAAYDAAITQYEADVEHDEQAESDSRKVAKPEGKPVQMRAQTAFFTATFSVMGHITAVDGEVNQDEYRIMQMLMGRMSLTDEQRVVAERIFEQGKEADFPLFAVLKQLKRECRNNSNLLRVFLEGQLHAAYADGELNRHEKDVLVEISKRLGFNRREFARTDNMVRAQHNLETTREAGSKSGMQRTSMSVDDAYAVLGLSSHVADGDIQKAYRRQMSQHHPDKLVAKGLPEEMVRMASEKTTEIRTAYEVLRVHRNF